MADVTQVPVEEVAESLRLRIRELEEEVLRLIHRLERVEVVLNVK